MSSFKIGSALRSAAAKINTISIDKFPVLVNRIIQKLHIKNARLFSEDEETQLRTLFSLDESDLRLVLDCLCYIFEQAAFNGVGPEPLYESVLLASGFDEPHGKVVGRVWSSEAAAYISKLKATTLGGTALIDSSYHLNMIVSSSTCNKQSEPTAIIELNLGHVGNNNTTTGSASAGKGGLVSEKLNLEFDHSELYELFNNLERIQKQLDNLG